MPFSFSVPAFLSPHARSAFRVGPRPVGRRSSAAAVLASIVAIAAASLTAPASASMLVTYEDTAGGLKFSYTGSFPVSAGASTTISPAQQIQGASFRDAFYNTNINNPTNTGFLIDITTYTTSVTNGIFTNKSLVITENPPNNSGDIFGIYIDPRSPPNPAQLRLPSNYTSGNTITGEATFSTASVASTGIQNQVITFTSGALSGQTVTFQAAAVPEPSTWALGAFALACGGWQLTRRRRALRVKA